MSRAATVSAAPSAPTAVPERPDLGFIKTKIAIEDLARQLGLDVSRHRARCWRVENHRNGDADPSLRFHPRKNRARCFVCDMLGGFSTLDLVMGVLGCDFPSAVAWICERFFVPSAKRGSPVGPRSRWRPSYRVGASGAELEPLVRSGLWAELTPTERAILPVLHAYRDLETGLTEISYLGLMRFAGVGSRKSVSRAVWRLRSLNALQVNRTQGVGVVQGCNRYQLTLDEPRFLRLLNEIHQRVRKEIERERAFRSQERESRKKIGRVFSCHSPEEAEKPRLRVADSGKGGFHPPAPPVSLSFSRTLRPSVSCTGELLRSTSEPMPNKPVHLVTPRGVKTAIPGSYQPPDEAECMRRARKQKAELDAWLAALQQAGGCPDG